MNELDTLNVELSGTNLIEASAGTGKTYAIACLYLRLLIEKGLTPDRILVVTFTEAATEELRGRIRSRIREALHVFAGTATDDPFLRALSANTNGRGPGRDAAVDILNRAISAFDTASIFTIHAFCLRALQDNAFESGSLYDTELVTDPSRLVQETVDDFWRMKFFGDREPLLKAVLGEKCSPETFAAFAGKMLQNPKVKILPDLGARDEAAVRRDCRESFEEVRKCWKERRAEIVHLLENDTGLSRNEKTYRKDLLPPLFDGMDAFTGGDNPCDLFFGFGKFCTSGIIKGKKPTGTAPRHPFFDACERLKQLVEERLLLLKWELLEFCRERLPLRKREANIRFFSDLLNDLHAALYGVSGDALARCLRDRYQAALIDEFQDTDPVQYDIFHALFHRPETPLFLIGDPKQAIYSFRGADIFAYMEASRRVDRDRLFTLTSNWRSTPALLRAFNTLFDNGRKPFIFDEIPYHPISSGKPEPGTVLILKGNDGAPLQVWTVPTGEGGKPLGVGTASDAVQVSVAAEIARLMGEGASGRACIEERGNGRVTERPVTPGDIAVIVRSHRQAGLIQEALRGAGIPSVMRSDETIFATREAGDVLTLLTAVADPLREPRVKAALATSIMGMSGNDLAALLDDEKAWEECLEKFRDYHQTWRDRGFMVMARTLLERDGVRGRLLRRPDGERRLTNVLHCFEALHQASHRGRLGMEGLLGWFGEKVASGEKSDEHQIRLETDEKAVKIVTVHVSKGLEYPIVFCPFMWGGIQTDRDVVTFHDGFAMVRDFGSDQVESHRVRAEKEALAESLRLLYVALTRAKYRCYLVAGKVHDTTGKNRPETSPVSYLFHAPADIRTADDLVARLAEEVRNLSAGDMEDHLAEVAATAGGAISVAPLPAADGPPPPVPRGDEEKPLRCRMPGAAIEREWRVASFTSFTRGESEAVELPDRDETGGGSPPPEPSAPVGEPQGKSIFTFPRGAQAGIFLHGIFEELDFSRADRDTVGGLVARGLERYGYDPQWQPHICGMVENVLSAHIPAPSGPFSLSDLREGSWLTELEFFFPLRFVTSDLVKRCLGKWRGSRDAVDLSRVGSSLGFQPVRGMLRGFMDMVFEHGGKFYLLDWKSNHLGDRPEDYARENIVRAMERHLYPLQYLLYTVALNRYLSLRVRGYHFETGFGGVLYVFLRGVRPEKRGETGIFMDIPPAPLVRELTEMLVDAETGGV